MIKEPVIYSEEELLRVWRLLDEERKARLTHIINFDYQQQRDKTRGMITVIWNEEAEMLEKYHRIDERGQENVTETLELEYNRAKEKAKKNLKVITGRRKERKG
jgi:hypothetical protein